MGSSSILIAADVQHDRAAHRHDDHDHDNYHDGDHDHHRRAASRVVGRCGPVLLRREEAGGNWLTERMYG